MYLFRDSHIVLSSGTKSVSVCLLIHFLSVINVCQGEAAAGGRSQVQPVQTASRPSERGAGAPGQPAPFPRGGDRHSGQTLHPPPERQLPASQELLLW